MLRTRYEQAMERGTTTSNNTYSNKATVKVVRQQLHEINDLHQKYKQLGDQHVALVNNFTDLKILNAHLLRENKELKALLDTAQQMLEQLRGERKEFVEDLKNFDWYGNKDDYFKLIKKWEEKQNVR